MFNVLRESYGYSLSLLLFTTAQTVSSKVGIVDIAIRASASMAMLFSILPIGLFHDRIYLEKNERQRGAVQSKAYATYDIYKPKNISFGEEILLTIDS